MEVKDAAADKPHHIEHTANDEFEPTSLTELGHDIAYGPDGIRGLASSGYVFGAAVLASLGGFSFGYDQGVISIINVMDQFHETYPKAATAFGKGFMTGMLLLGAFVGCFFMPYIADKISRKRAITVAVVFFNVGAILQTAATDYGMLVAGRAIGGIGVGTLAMVSWLSKAPTHVSKGAPLYISEIAPPNLRGTLLVLEDLSIVFAIVIAYWITYGTKELSGEKSFRLPFGLQMVCSTILGVCINFFPYSPRWLALVGRTDESLASLCKLRGLPATDSRIQAEYKGIVGEIAVQKAVQEKMHPGRKGPQLEVRLWLDLLKPRFARRTIVGCGVMVI